MKRSLLRKLAADKPQYFGYLLNKLEERKNASIEKEVSQDNNPQEIREIREILYPKKKFRGGTEI